MENKRQEKVVNAVKENVLNEDRKEQEADEEQEEENGSI